MVVVKETTSIKLNKQIKEEAKEVFAQLGISMGDAVNMFLAQVSMTKSIPFDIKIPNETTNNVLDDIVNGKNIEKFSFDEIKTK
ncbi:MAG: type II toxin-antitoxin system RelB/DinJ family antitoxin [Campylobacterota bacterium]|nr:type II toxin-antitoxin system RelB/DinJ family antitoxin [Campylobacterota bacterium]